MPYVLLPGDNTGSPVFGLFPDERHAIHVRNLPTGSLVIEAFTPPSIFAAHLGLPRVLMIGDLAKLDSEDAAAARAQFLATHAQSEPFLDEYVFYRLTPNQVTLVSRDTNFFEGHEYAAAPVDAVAPRAQAIVREMNLHQEPALRAFCKVYGEVETKQAFMFGVDSLGFDLMARVWDGDAAAMAAATGEEAPEDTDDDGGAGEEWVALRLPFPFEVRSPEECSEALESAIKQIAPHIPPDSTVRTATPKTH